MFDKPFFLSCITAAVIAQQNIKDKPWVGEQDLSECAIRSAGSVHHEYNFKYKGQTYYCRQDEINKRYLLLASDATQVMYIQYYIAVTPEDSLLMLKQDSFEVECEYPDCPHYFFAEMTLVRSDRNFQVGEAITQSLDFWEVEPTMLGWGRRDPTGEKVRFYESFDVTALQPEADASLDFEQIQISQDCGNINETVSDCPWSAAAASCWETGTDEVKFVMRRRLEDHYVAETGASYYLRGGFTYQMVDENGQIVEETVVGEAISFPLFDSALKLGLAMTISVIIASSMLI